MSESDLSGDQSEEDFLLNVDTTSEADDEDAIDTQLSPLGLIVELSWQAIAKRRDFRTLPRGPKMAVIVQVPTDSWIDPVHSYVHENDGELLIIDGKANIEIA